MKITAIHQGKWGYINNRGKIPSDFRRWFGSLCIKSPIFTENSNLRNFHLNGKINRTELFTHAVYEQPCVLFISWSQYRKPQLTMQRSRTGWIESSFTHVKGSPDLVFISIFTIPYFPEITIFGLVYGGSESSIHL